MQHAVRVANPGCSIFGAKLPEVPLDINISFARSFPGGFKIAHTALGLICLSVIAHISQLFHPLTGSSLGLLCSNSAAYFLLVTYGCFVTSLILLICCFLSHFAASFIPKTVFEFIYHAFACVSYLISSLTLMLTVIMSNTENGRFKEPAYAAKITVSVLGLINTVLYGVSAYFSFESQKQMN